ncbi:MAG: family protein 3-like [Rickettsiaceae bacterium]|jgi:hypothetical protein|nr:family protein 3-like [Rickettsiaceae bacterium]
MQKFSIRENKYLNIHLNAHYIINDTLKDGLLSKEELLPIIKIYLAQNNFFFNIMANISPKNLQAFKYFNQINQKFLKLFSSNISEQQYLDLSKFLNILEENIYSKVIQSTELSTRINSLLVKDEKWMLLFNEIMPKLSIKIQKKFEAYEDKLSTEYYKDIVNNSVENYSLKVESLSQLKNNINKLKIFGKALSKNTSIKDLYVDFEGTDINFIPTIIKLLRENTAAKNLNIKIPYNFKDHPELLSEFENVPNITKFASDVPINWDNWKLFNNAFKNWPKLEKLDLNLDGLNTTLLTELLETLTNKKTLTDVSLCFDELSADSARMLAQILENNIIPIKDLKVISEAGILSSIFLALKNNKTVQALDIDSEINKSEAIILADSLKENTTLKQLLINDNNIEDQGLIALVEALPKTKITSLNLTCPNDSCDHPQGIKALTEVLAQNIPLFDLTIEGNEISLENFNSLIKALEQNKFLSDLNLIQCFEANTLTQGIPLLAKYLENNKTLTNLSFSYEEFDDLRAKQILDALKNNSCLKELTFKNIEGLSDEILTYIAELIKTNQTLTHIDLTSENDDLQYNNIQNLKTLRDELEKNTLLTLTLNNDPFQEINPDMIKVINEIKALSSRNQQIMDKTEQALNNILNAIYELDSQKIHPKDTIINENIFQIVSLKDLALVQENKYHVKAILDKVNIAAKLAAFHNDEPVKLLCSGKNLNDIDVFYNELEEIAANHYLVLKGVSKNRVIKQDSEAPSLLLDLPKDIQKLVYKYIVSDIKSDNDETKKKFKQALEASKTISNNNNNNAQPESHKRKLEEAPESELPKNKSPKHDTDDQAPIDLSEPAQHNDPMELTGASNIDNA